MSKKLSIVKIGGNIIENTVELLKFLQLFSALEEPKILVHGGGKKASEVMQQMGMVPKMHNGRRITDAESLDVAIMVYGGLINKKIVAHLQALQCNALGMSGADANGIQAHKRPVVDVDYGFAGDVDRANADGISGLLGMGLTPVFCALTHDGNGQLLNTNADTIASEVAIALSDRYETTLFYCFEMDGVLRDISDKSSVIKRIDSVAYQKLREEKIISDGMLPKMHNCFHALKSGVTQVKMGNLGMFHTEDNNYTTLVL
ncbi:MAG: acetylglutamate kinase [Flavobacteriaceae bacterium]